MIVLALLLAAPADDLRAQLRHLEAAAAAWAPAPSPDGRRVAFLTTLFGSRQAASVAVEGGYPIQLTDEPSGVAAVRLVPPEGRQAVVTALRNGHRRLLLVDEDGGAPEAVDAAPGDQFPGGFSLDGKRMYYARQDGGPVSLHIFSLEPKTRADVTPPPPAAGHPPPSGTLPLEQALAGLFELGPPSPDGRALLALVRRSGSEAVVLVDLSSARAVVLADSAQPARFRQPRFSPDGRTVYVLTDAGRGRMGVDAIAVQDHARKKIYAPEQEVDAFALSDDGHRLAVALESNGQDLFSLLDFPTLRAQPLAAPPSGSLAEGGMSWDRPGERLFFGWRLADDTTDVWELQVGRGTPVRITRSPRPGLGRHAIPRPTLVRIAGDTPSWLWRPADSRKPRVAVLVAREPTRPVFDKRITALNFAGFAVLAANGPNAQKTALSWLESASDLDPHEPLLLDFDGLTVEDRAKWAGVVGAAGQSGAGLELDPDHPDLQALIRYARRGSNL